MSEIALHQRHTPIPPSLLASSSVLPLIMSLTHIQLVALNYQASCEQVPHRYHIEKRRKQEQAPCLNQNELTIVMRVRVVSNPGRPLILVHSISIANLL